MIKKLWLKFKEYFLYIVFGGLTTVVNYAVYIPLTKFLGVDPLIANVMAWIVAVAFAYVTNRKWVFESKASGTTAIIMEAGSFVVARLFSLIVEEVMLWVLSDILHISDLVVKIIASIVTIIINYVLSKFIVFKKKDGRNMQDRFRSFFINDRVLYMSPVLFIILEVVSEILYFLNGWFDPVYTIERVALAACLVVMAVAYKRHEKNVMKPLMGAVLLGIFMSDLPYASDLLSNHQFYCDKFESIWSVYEIMEIMLLIGYIAIFISHLVINSDHHSNPGKVKFNQIIILATLAIYLIQVVVSILIRRDAIFIFSKVSSFLANVTLLNMVVCIESRLDMFRIAREAKGWQEKKTED